MNYEPAFESVLPDVPLDRAASQISSANQPTIFPAIADTRVDLSYFAWGKLHRERRTRRAHETSRARDIPINRASVAVQLINPGNSASFCDL